MPPPQLSPGSRFRAKPGVLVRELPDEAVLLDLEASHYFSLNATGWRIWQHVAAGATVAETLAALEGEFDAPREALAADLAALLEELEGAGLLQREG